MKKFFLFLLLINVGVLAGLLFSWAFGGNNANAGEVGAAFVLWPLLMILSFSMFFSCSIGVQICLGLGILLFVTMPFVKDEWRYAQITIAMALLSIKTLDFFLVVMSA